MNTQAAKTAFPPDGLPLHGFLSLNPDSYWLQVRALTMQRKHGAPGFTDHAVRR
jgi:hypothetical protein